MHVYIYTVIFNGYESCLIRMCGDAPEYTLHVYSEKYVIVVQSKAIQLTSYCKTINVLYIGTPNQGKTCISLIYNMPEDITFTYIIWGKHLGGIT